MTDVRLMTLDPGHFHAALVHGEMYPDVAPRVDIFAPVGPDLVAHLHRLAAFNRRSARPTSWAWEVHAGPDFFARMLRERPGNVVVLSGRNRDKIGRIRASIEAGIHVLADKPWVLQSSDLPQLEAALAEADARGLVAYDIMTERFEATHALQRALVNDAATFGRITAGDANAPAVYMESVHYLKKMVAGAPNIRPAWFFDTAEQGEGLNDVGTHLVDLVQWTLFPGDAIQPSDIQLLDARRWPTRISESDFRSVTNAPSFPSELSDSLVNGQFDYYCNTLVSYTVRGVHTTLNIAWDWEPLEAPGDTHFAYYRGTRARVEVRQTRADGYRPELYVVPNRPDTASDVLAAVRARIASLQSEFPGTAAVDRGGEIHVTIPEALRVGHEAHFAQVTETFLSYLSDRSALPAWERPNMLAKYYVTTRATELSRQHAPIVAPRLAPG
jgi:predicted dehydrogenase